MYQQDDEAKCDRAEVERTIKVFCDPSGVHEARIPNVPQSGVISGYFDSDHRHEMVEVCCYWSGRAPAVYFTLNPLIAALLGRAANRAVPFAKRTTADAEIIGRRWFFIDIDPVRPVGISSTDEEYDAALQRALEIRSKLGELGFPEPILASSGNGWHLHYRVDFPNEHCVTDLFNRVLKVIASMFRDNIVGIDLKVGNPSRICKVYGTLVCKGDALPDRPHRVAYMKDVPDQIDLLQLEVMNAMAAKLQKLAPKIIVPNQAKSPAMTFDLRQWFQQHSVPVTAEKEWQDGTLFEVNPCPWNAEHNRGEAFVIQHGDGGISAHCHHDSCAGKGWREFRDAFDPGWRDRPDSFTAIEADDDPHRLARLILVGEFTHADGYTLLRYRGAWYSWKGAIWRPLGDDEIKTKVIRSVKAEFDLLSIQAQTTRSSREKTTAQKVGDYLIRNVLHALHSLVQLSTARDQPFWVHGDGTWPADQVLAARNALIHLPSIGGSRDFSCPPTPRYFNTTAVEYDFQTDAPAPEKWLAFLHQLWEDDEESIATLQEWMGYLLTADTRQQKILLFIGPPRSGRGVITRVISALLGPGNVAHPTLASFATNFGLAALLGKRLAVVEDARLSYKTDVASVVQILLSISGEDSITSDRKYKSHVTGKMDCRLMIVTNELPNLKETSGALAARLLVLKLTTSFEGKEDRWLTDKLLAELPSILNWAIEGYKRLHQRDHFLQPTTGKDLLEQQRELSSPTLAFIKECCVEGPEHEIIRGDLFEAYLRWADRNGHAHKDTAATFGRNLLAVRPKIDTRGQRKVGSKKERFYGGIALRPESKA